MRRMAHAETAKCLTLCNSFEKKVESHFGDGFPVVTTRALIVSFVTDFDTNMVNRR